MSGICCITYTGASFGLSVLSYVSVNCQCFHFHVECFMPLLVEVNVDHQLLLFCLVEVSVDHQLLSELRWRSVCPCWTTQVY